MRYHGKGNPLAVLISCLTLGFLPQILFVLAIIWLVTNIPVWAWIVAGATCFVVFVWKAYKESK